MAFGLTPTASMLSKIRSPPKNGADGFTLDAVDLGHSRLLQRQGFLKASVVTNFEIYTKIRTIATECNADLLQSGMVICKESRSLLSGFYSRYHGYRGDDMGSQSIPPVGEVECFIQGRNLESGYFEDTVHTSK